MTDLTRPDRGEAIERLASKVRELDTGELGAYLVVCMAVLCSNAADVAQFIMDRADEKAHQADVITAMLGIALDVDGGAR